MEYNILDTHFFLFYEHLLLKCIERLAFCQTPRIDSNTNDIQVNKVMTINATLSQSIPGKTKQLSFENRVEEILHLVQLPLSKIPWTILAQVRVYRFLCWFSQWEIFWPPEKWRTRIQITLGRERKTSTETNPSSCRLMGRELAPLDENASVCSQCAATLLEFAFDFWWVASTLWMKCRLKLSNTIQKYWKPKPAHL